MFMPLEEYTYAPARICRICTIFCSICIFCICIFLIYDAQNKALLDTLRLKKSNTTQSHICLYSTLLIGHTKHRSVMRISSWPFVPKKLQLSNRQDYVFIRLPGISDGAFQLRIDNIWFCKLLRLFSIDTMTDAGMKTHECAYVSVLEEYKGHRRPGYILHILYIVQILHILVMILFDCCAAWLDACWSTIVYERHESAQVWYVIPVSSILGRLPLVPVGNTGTSTVLDVKGSGRLSRRFLLQNKGRQRRLQVVVREQLGPQLG